MEPVVTQANDSVDSVVKTLPNVLSTLANPLSVSCSRGFRTLISILVSLCETSNDVRLCAISIAASESQTISKLCSASRVLSLEAELTCQQSWYESIAVDSMRFR